eukprot:11078122-Heterocapsa_arctica.AAC.1
MDNALENSHKDTAFVARQQERLKEQELNRFKAIFNSMDADGNGQLDWPEFGVGHGGPGPGQSPEVRGRRPRQLRGDLRPSGQRRRRPFRGRVLRRHSARRGRRQVK